MKSKTFLLLVINRVASKLSFLDAGSEWAQKIVSAAQWPVLPLFLEAFMELECPVRRKQE